VLDEASQALQTEYDFSAGEMARWVRDVMTQTTNPILGDTVKRLAADPRRKLSREDRLIGPTLLARKHGVESKHLVRAIAAGLRYNDPDDPGAVYVQQRIATLGLSAAVREVCGLTDVELDLVEALVRNYHRPRVDKT
jgi:mannitol-1-phosphate 5-dehydrogenase